MKKSGLLLLGMLFVLLLAACSESSDSGLPDGDDSTDGDDATDGDGETAPDGDGEPPVDGDDDAGEGDIEESWPDYRAVEEVNPFIATGGTGFGIGSGFPGPKAPFGLIAPGPESRGTYGTTPIYHNGGYYTEDVILTGFAHTHMYGVGIAAYGNIQLTPIAGAVDEEAIKEDNYMSTFDKATEEAMPGYYAVTLDDSGARVELTATERAAHHRYTYPESVTTASVLLDLAHTCNDGRVEDGTVTIVPAESRVEGGLRVYDGFSGRYDGVWVYFSARFNKAFQTSGTWENGEITEDSATAGGADFGAYFTFDISDGAPLEVRIALSFVGVENARANLETELPDWDFEAARQALEDRWEETIDRVRFFGGSERQRTIMATAVYHSFFMPDIFSDADGGYTGFDGAAHTAENFTYYTDFSMWDTYRTQHPLLNLVARNESADMMQSLVRMYEQGGKLPKWPMGSGYTGCMVGRPADVILADAYLKGVRAFDAATAYEGMLAHAQTPVEEGESKEYVESGYVHADLHGGSVSKTMEYALADDAVANLAAALDDAENAALYKERAGNYKHLWKEDIAFFWGKNGDGTWAEGFDPLPWTDVFTEGNAWQYLWLTPHDPKGLVDLFGSEAAMLAKLTEFFEQSEAESQGPNYGIVPPHYYWHGNEPDLHAAYFFNLLGRPDLTQYYVRWIMERVYTENPDGIPGNDDCGTLSAWYVFSATGFYPISGTTTYLVGSPLFERVEMTMGEHALIVEAPGTSDENRYVQSVTLNGKALNEPWFDHADIAQGGVLHFEMGPNPSDWGSAAVWE